MTYKPADYSKSLIYKLVCLDTDIKDIYVGSTTSLKHRRYQHKNCCNNEKNKDYNSYVYKFIRENGGWGNWDMILVESYPCKSSLDLHKREREIIEQLKPTLNKNIPLRTNKEWRGDNKEQLAVYKEKNKEHIAEQKKEYNEKNKEHIAKKQKEYKEKNKEHIAKKEKEYKQTKVECECGVIITKSHLARHKQSKKHQNYINALHSHHT